MLIMDRDVFLYKQLGICNHINWYTGNYHTFKCPDCKEDVRGFKRDLFSTWDGFGKLWEWAEVQDWFDLYQYEMYYADYTSHNYKFGDEKNDNDHVMRNELINPDLFANSIYEFLLKQKEVVKTCDNCGRYEDCRNSSANWKCFNESAWEEK